MLESTEAKDRGIVLLLGDGNVNLLFQVYDWNVCRPYKLH